MIKESVETRFLLEELYEEKFLGGKIEEREIYEKIIFYGLLA